MYLQNRNEASVVERGKEQEVRVLRLAGALSFNNIGLRTTGGALNNGKRQYKICVIKRCSS